jgi:hypothetical protein
MKRIWISLGLTIYIALLLATHGVVGMAASPPPLRPDAILADVQVHGARSAVAALWADTNRWNQLLARIGTGNRRWLEVAAVLRKGTDAGASEELDESVFLALRPNPRAVLELLKARTFDVGAVCNGNIADDYPAAQSKRFLAERIQVLQGFSESATTAVQDQCLAGLRMALDGLR